MWKRGGSPQRSIPSAEARRIHEVVHFPEEVQPTRKSKVEKELEVPSPHVRQASKDADTKERPLSIDTPTQRESKVVAEPAEVAASMKEVISEGSLHHTHFVPNLRQRRTAHQPYTLPPTKALAEPEHV